MDKERYLMHPAKCLILVFCILLVVSGCSSTGNVVSSSYNSSDPTHVNYYSTYQKGTETRGGSSQRLSSAQSAEEDDDISLLLEPGMLEKFDIPIVFNEAVQYYIRFFSVEKKKVFGNWLRRSRQYVPMIRKVLREHGLPEDLVYLAMIESGFNPRAYSPMKACGPWQFIYATGERYGLRADYWVDERKDPEKSTVAAAKYLKDLFNQFGCWYLAAAGYNAGEGRIERAIEKHNTSNFWELVKYNTLPKETSEYIPKLIAAAIIAKDPEKFGFEGIVYDAPISFVRVNVPGATRLHVIARAASTDLAVLQSLNPEILRGITPPNRNQYTIKIPSPLRDGFESNLRVALSKEKRVTKIVKYRAKRGDTLARIMKRYRLSSADFCLVNECGGSVKIRRGTLVNIPKFGRPSGGAVSVAQRIDEREEKSLRVVAKANALGMSGPHRKEDKKEERARIASEKTWEAKNKEPIRLQDKPRKQNLLPTYHVVKKGENLQAISDKYGIEIDDIKRINRIRGDRVYPNMKIRLASYTERKKSRTTLYVVRKGDTLTRIALKHGVDISDIRTANKLRSDKVYPRMKLKIPREAS